MKRKSDPSGSDDAVGEEPGEQPDQRPVGEYVRLLGPRGEAEQLADDVAGRSRGDVRSALAWWAG